MFTFPSAQWSCSAEPTVVAPARAVELTRRAGCAPKTRMLAHAHMPNSPSTLVEALSALPRGSARGFRFLGSDGQERYFPYEALEAEARRRAALLVQSG